MKILHRISVNSTPQIRHELLKMGVDINGNGFITFEVDESSDVWPQLHAWIAREKVADVVRTKFSAQEISAARYFRLVPEWHDGYPQPNELEFGYREATYDLTDYCSVCGIGMRQKAAFQMKGEPKWGKRGIFQLNWVHDKYFVTPDVWKNVFKIHGVGSCPVLNTKGDQLMTVVQLVVNEEAEIITSNLHDDGVCARCRRKKFLPVTRGFFPAPENDLRTHMAKTNIYFGSGASAYKALLVSRNVADSLVINKVKGASLWPVE